jgi:hypothetical protein
MPIPLAPTMTALARISVLTGPDRGRVCEVAEEVAHVGRGADCHLSLRDPDVSDHQFSVVERNARFAIFTPIADTVFVEGLVIPPDKWVWLPDIAEIRLSKRTQLRFEVVEGGAAVPVETPAETTAETREADQAEPLRRAKARASKANGASQESPVVLSPTTGAMGNTGGGGPVGTESLANIPRPKRGGKGESRKVARFITDGPGEPLVRLGDDGHLPELALKEGAARLSKEAESSESNPLVMYGVLAFSVLASMGLLLVDVDVLDLSGRDRAAARVEIQRFYGEEGKPLRPHQIHLRQASQAESRRDGDRARAEYRKVLDMLRAEGNDRTLTGVTGSREEDRELERLIGVMLSK